MQRNLLIIGCFLAALAVILGAFGAHGLKAMISPEHLQVFETGVKYQFYHTFAIIMTALLLEKFNHAFTTYAAFCFIIGIVLFSGSLYLLATRTLLGIENLSLIGPMTPIGGLFFIVGWVLLAVSVMKNG
ncbi:MAG: DUF423 domain-containing protein [Chitinophagales bacterium]